MHINVQPIEKRIDADGSVLSVHSIFSTIQGEGPFSGHPAVFLRLAGCNLQCPGCDTEYTVGRKTMSVDQVVEAVKKLRQVPTLKRGAWFNSYPLVVITGGEPFRQNITPLVEELTKRCYTVQVETNGTLPPSANFPRWATIVCSPKTGKINPIIAKRADYFKYVLSHDDVSDVDGLPKSALRHPAVPSLARHPEDHKHDVYLQPMDAGPGYEDITAANVQACVDSCMKYGHVLQLQIHKIIGVA